MTLRWVCGAKFSAILPTTSYPTSTTMPVTTRSRRAHALSKEPRGDPIDHQWQPGTPNSPPSRRASPAWSIEDREPSDAERGTQDDDERDIDLPTDQQGAQDSEDDEDGGGDEDETDEARQQHALEQIKVATKSVLMQGQ